MFSGARRLPGVASCRPASANALHHAVAVYGGHTEVHVIALARTNEGSEPVRLMLTWWRAEVDVCGILGWSASRNASPSAAGTETDLQSDL